MRCEFDSFCGWRIVPVPIHPEGLRDRGYNQAGLLADALGERLELEVSHNHLDRRDSGVRQSSLDQKSRYRHAKQVYRLGGSDMPIASACVFLVDDVLTTGATVSVCRDLLASAGVSRVVAVTAARTVDYSAVGPPEQPVH